MLVVAISSGQTVLRRPHDDTSFHSVMLPLSEGLIWGFPAKPAVSVRLSVSLSVSGLRRYEASMEEPDLDKGGSPLMHAANCGHAAAVTALIEVHAPILSPLPSPATLSVALLNGSLLFASQLYALEVPSCTPQWWTVGSPNAGFCTSRKPLDVSAAY